MDKPCAIQADFADFRRVKGRKVLQLFFEIPLEQSEEALRVLGHPIVGESKWCAIALLDLSKPSATPQPQVAPPKDRRHFSSLPLSQQAAIRCGDAAFQDWLKFDATQTVQFVRTTCGVASRSELDSEENRAARSEWQKIEKNYQEHLTTLRYGAGAR